MEIQNWIHHRLFETNFQIYDPKGTKIDVEKFRSEYLKLKVWLSHVEGGVGIKLPKDHRYLMTLLACMDAGVSYVPLKENYPSHRTEQIKTETGFEVLLDEEMFHQILKGPEKNVLARQVQDQNILYIICTSGSTGRPKAVVVERSSLTHFWKWVETKFSHVNEGDRSIQVTDFTFDISLIDVGLFLSRGCALYFSEFSGNIFTLAYEVEKYGVTVLNTVVNNVNMLLDEKVVYRANFSKLHTVMMGGARFSYGLYKKCKEHLRHCGVHNLYGVTEVPVYSHCTTMIFDDSD
jgi:D-alanine--poly(phosphoribitol) ligase subunit 1